MATQQDNWEAVKALFEAALEVDSARRSSLLKERCADASVCAEVERLLAEHDEAASFLSAGLPPGASPEPSTASLFSVPVDPAARTQQLSESQILAGRFRIVRYIAGGGMGEVYEAEDQELRERVAVKTIRREILVQPNAMARFKREVFLARKVTHPNVCRIFDLFRHKPEDGSVQEEIVFISMELLRGKTLAARMNGKRMSAAAALPLVRQMASALAAAHDVGIVHRDFKPGNVVLVGASGERAVVTDFGLALQAETTDEGVSLSTGAGVLGTPAYMAPEQLEGGAATNASDIYALGLVIYEMVTGQRPFPGNNPLSSAFKRLSETPRPPRFFAPDLSPAWESVILRCLARDPRERFTKAQDVATALAEDLPQAISAPASRPAERTRSRRLAWLAAPALILFVLAAVGGYKWRTRHAVEPIIAVAGFKNISGDPAYDWLATDLSETFTADLGASKGIQTVPAEELARTRIELSIPAVQALEDGNLAEVRQALGANYLLLGTYSVDGQSGEKRLAVDLRIEDFGGKTVASVHRAGSENDYGKLVTELAAVALAKLGTAGPPESETSQLRNLYPGNPEARKLYFEAIEKLRSLDAPAALDLLKKAEEKDPENVSIHSALSDSWAMLKHDREAAGEAKSAADLAQRTPLPFEYVVLAQARSEEMNRDWDGAIKDYSLLFPHYPQLNYGLRLASAQLDGSQPKAALATLQQIASLRMPMNTDPRIDIAKAKVYGATSDFSAELQSAQSALAEAQKRNARLLQANAELELCWAHRNLGHVEEALAACNQAQSIFSVFGDNVSAAVALNHVATWLSDRGRYAEAKDLYDRIIRIHRAAGDQKDLAGANVNAATVLVRMGRPLDAQDYIHSALQTAGPIQDKEDEALAHILEGKVFSAGAHGTEAEAEYRKALVLAQHMGNTRIQATALSNLAEIQSETNSTAALAAYKNVVKLRRGNSDRTELATCLFNMGDLQYHRGELDASEASYREAMQISADQKDRPGVALGSISLAQINLERNRLADAESEARDALQTLKEAPDPDLESAADSVLLRAMVGEGKLTEAGTYADRIRQIASQDPDTSFDDRMSLAIYLGSIGHAADAVQQIRTLPTEARQAGRNFAALEAELLLLQIQPDGHAAPESRREALFSIRQRAQRAGFNLLINRMAHIHA